MTNAVCAWAGVWLIVGLLLPLSSAAGQLPALKTEPFDRDPGWDCWRRRQVLGEQPVVREHFGYSPTSFAGSEPGEIGGRVQRSIEPAYYAKRISPRTLKSKLSASGVLALTQSESSSGASFGWFNHRRLGFRTVNSIAFRLDGENWGARLHVDYCTGTWKAVGLNTGIRVKPDGKPHKWTLSYDPDADGGDGAVTFTLDDLPPQVLKLAVGHKAEGAVFDRFGLFNQQIPGNSLTVYLDDVSLDGKTERFASDPRWESRRNCGTFKGIADDSQDFGFSPTRFAGGRRAGEVGGTFWRTEADADTHAYYADRVGPLSLDDKLQASGKIAFTDSAVDSGVYLGWFSAEAFKRPPVKAEQVLPSEFVGLLIEGPSNVGHYVRPALATRTDYRVAASGPVILPDGKPHTWTLAYDPKTNNSNGAVTVSLDGVPVVLNLEPGLRRQGASLDRFGLRTTQTVSRAQLRKRNTISIYTCR